MHGRKMLNHLLLRLSHLHVRYMQRLVKVMQCNQFSASFFKYSATLVRRVYYRGLPMCRVIKIGAFRPYIVITSECARLGPGQDTYNTD